jgi:hypothetical protein
MMQNAVPHAGGENVDLTLQVDPAADRIEIAVSNPATVEQFQDLEGRLARINGEPDPLQSYLRAMAEAPMNQRGGLGLARVRFEAQLDLSITHEGNRITVLAKGSLRTPLLEASGGSHV